MGTARSKFHHEEIYRGKDFMKKLSTANITICGAGALGSNLVDTLARQGFSSIKVIDMDRVEVHNINTQVWGDMDVGAQKADALKNRIFRHVGTEITSVAKELTASNAKTLLKGASLVVDAFDNTPSRQLVQTICREQKLQCLHAGLFADYGEVIWDERYKVPPKSDGDVCDYPLARNLISIVVAITAEEILNFLTPKPRRASWSVTLKDLAIRQL